MIDEQWADQMRKTMKSAFDDGINMVMIATDGDSTMVLNKLKGNREDMEKVFHGFALSQYDIVKKMYDGKPDKEVIKTYIKCIKRDMYSLLESGDDR